MIQKSGITFHIKMEIILLLTMVAIIPIGKRLNIKLTFFANTRSFKLPFKGFSFITEEYQKKEIIAI